jgi:NACalpha-BTF3-like transcription factor
MGGNKKNKGNKSNGSSNPQNHSKKNNSSYPFVSVCTPTFNRRPFIPMAIKCFQEYDYPKDRMEWIIIDDGTDKIEDLVKDIPQVKYFKYDRQMILGKKRNLMHEKASGDFIVYQDDDDYYPPERISYGIKLLQDNPQAMLAGNSTIFLYFKHINQMYRFGPYGPNHATAGTFIFRKELKNNKYDDFKALAEEKDFLKDYTVPVIQMDPLKSILVFSHEHNTFDKRKLLANAPNPTCNPDMNIKVEDFIKNAETYNFFMKDIDSKLKDYTPGDVKYKEEVLNQIELISKNREKMVEEANDIRRKNLEREDLRKIMEINRKEVQDIKTVVAKTTAMNNKLIETIEKITNGKGNTDDKIDIENIKKENNEFSHVNDLEVLKAELIVKQRPEHSNIEPQLVNNIMGFISQSDFQVRISINGTIVDLTGPFSSYGFKPAESSSKMWEKIAKEKNNSNDMNPNPMNNVINTNTHIINSDKNITEEEQTVISQTECNISTARKALYATNNDVIEAIINIDRYKTEDVVENIDSSLTQEEQTVMSQTQCNIDVARKALSATNSDVIEAIINIDKYKSDNSTIESSEKQDDVEIVSSQTGCSIEDAKKMLLECNGDTITAIIKIAENIEEGTKTNHQKSIVSDERA